jgi:hypothetical protein
MQSQQDTKSLTTSKLNSRHELCFEQESLYSSALRYTYYTSQAALLISKADTTNKNYTQPALTSTASVMESQKVKNATTEKPPAAAKMEAALMIGTATINYALTHPPKNAPMPVRLATKCVVPANSTPRNAPNTNHQQNPTNYAIPLVIANYTSPTIDC